MQTESSGTWLPTGAPARCLSSSCHTLKIPFHFLLVCNVSVKKQAFLFNFGHLDIYFCSLVALKDFSRSLDGSDCIMMYSLCCARVCLSFCDWDSCICGNTTFINFGGKNWPLFQIFHSSFLLGPQIKLC